jgi:hypothetical protein
MIENKPNHDKLSASSAARSEFAKESNRKRGEKTEENIIDAILGSEPNGLRTHELAKRVGKDRETIRKICNKLIAERKILKIGKFGYYHVTEEFVSQDSGILVRLFKRDAINKLFDNSYFKIIKDDEINKALEKSANIKRNNIGTKKIQNKEENKNELLDHYKENFVDFNKDFSKENLIFNKLMDSIVLTPYLESDRDEKIENRLIEDRKQAILNFSLKMGILFTFIMIESMTQTDRGIIRTKIQGQDFRFSESWISNSTDALEIWKQFQEVIRVLTRTKNVNSNGEVKIFNRKNEKYESLFLDEIVRNELIETFKEIWPYSFEVLQNSISDSLKPLKSFYNKTPQEFDEYNKNIKKKLKQIKENKGKYELTDQGKTK